MASFVSGFIAIRVGIYNRLCVELTANVGLPKTVWKYILSYFISSKARCSLCFRGLKRHILQEYDLSDGAPKIFNFQILDTKVNYPAVSVLTIAEV